jgi:hypothetical protein
MQLSRAGTRLCCEALMHGRYADDDQERAGVRPWRNRTSDSYIHGDDKFMHPADHISLGASISVATKSCNALCVQHHRLATFAWPQTP